MAALVLILAGCREDRPSVGYLKDATLVSGNGFLFGMYGNRTAGWAPDSQDPNGPPPEEIGLALQVEAQQLQAKTGVNGLDVFRSLDIRVVDDYSFQVDSRWATGMYFYGTIVLALWSLREVSTKEEIPGDAPAWTIRAPENGRAWRYGYWPLVPAGDHELGHHFFGPGYEH